MIAFFAISGMIFWLAAFVRLNRLWLDNFTELDGSINILIIGFYVFAAAFFTLTVFIIR